jgi:predicted kinase
MSQPTLYLLLGYPGAGKTTTAQSVQRVTGAVHLWADQVRRELFTQPTFSDAEHQALYERMNQQTAELLAKGKSVVFDTNFRHKRDRQRLREIASEYKARVILLWIVTDKAIARQRATRDADKQPTRVLGDMPLDKFEFMTSDVELPSPDEQYIQVDGTRVTDDYIRELLH